MKEEYLSEYRVGDPVVDAQRNSIVNIQFLSVSSNVNTSRRGPHFLQLGFTVEK